MLTSAAVALTARGVRHVLPDGREIFRGVDLTVAPGQAVAIVGPSGVGKSTLLAIVGGLIPATAGSVTTVQPTSVAWILQSLNGLGARTAEANAMLLAVLDGDDREQARRRAHDHLEALDLGPVAGQRLRTLSGGELQRLACARALTSRRPVIIADEPTSQLDRRRAAEVMALLTASAADDGRAVLIVTHDVDALPAGADVWSLGPDGLTP